MTIPPEIRQVGQRVADMVRGLVPRFRVRFTADETELAIHLRSNDKFRECLYRVIESRIAGRASAPVPSNPTDCLASMARDHELRQLINRMEFVRQVSGTQPADEDGEQPA